MSRSALFNINCQINSISNSTDDYGQYIKTSTLKSTPRCSYRDLRGDEIVALGLPVDNKLIRVYLEYDIDVTERDEISINGFVYEVIWVDKLGLRSGLCKGIQADCKYVGFCSRPEFIYFYYNSSALTTINEFSSWVEMVPSINTSTPIEGESYKLSIEPDPSINNIIIAYPATIRALDSVIQEKTGMQLRNAWINSRYSVNIPLMGINYRVYQLIPQIPWELDDSFLIGL